MSRQRDDKGIFFKQKPPKPNQPSMGAGTSTSEKKKCTTPTAGKSLWKN